MALTPATQLARLIAKIKEWQAARFFGNVDVEFHNGNITRCMKHESIKLETPDELERYRGPAEEAGQ